MATTTSRLGLHKPADDGSEFVDVSVDLNQNLDKLDAVVGFVPTTSSTPPGSPFAGMARQETDTGRAFYRNGDNNAWIQLLNAGSTFDSAIELTSGKRIGMGTTASGTNIDINAPSLLDSVLSYKIASDTYYRHILTSTGFSLGSGIAVPDVAVFRSGPGTLSLTGNLDISGTLDVTGQSTLDNTTVADLTVSGAFTWQSFALPKWLEGQEAFSIGSGVGSASRAVAFGTTLSRIPRVFCNLDSTSGQMGGWTARAASITATGFSMLLYSNGANTTLASTTNVQWVALY